MYKITKYSITNHKSEDYKLTAVEYYLTEDISQEQVCRIFKCSPKSLMRWVEKYEEEDKYKDKLIVLYNTSSHRNDKIKELVNKNNKLLYAVPYQHFTNSIKNYFTIIKARLRKIEGLTHSEIKQNISNVVRNIPKEKYENIFKGAYNRKCCLCKK